MHIHKASTTTAWPNVAFESWRLWDAGVTWPDLEPNRGEWHFDLLDKYLDLAQQHHVEILLTLGLTPQWASARPDEKSDYRPGNAAEPRDMQDWREYVRTLATRYKGKIHEYEIWNEPKRRTAFSGDVRTMVEMTREASEILKQVDPANIVVSASSNGENGGVWLDQYLSQGAGRYVDVIGYHFYVFPEAPEKMPPLILSVRQTMAAHGIANKPLWNTESGWSKPKVFASPAEAAAFVSRAYILNWAAGVSRFYWYAWDNHGWVTLEMTDRDTQQPTAAAAAYATTRTWLLGAIMKSCKSDPDGTWVCELSRGNARSWIVWNPGGTEQFRIPPSWQIRSVADLSGADRKIAGESVAIGISPLLLQD
jgi:hypothetical protein